MRALIKILIFLIPFNIFATPQSPERLLFKDDTIWIHNFPLEKLREKNSNIDQKLNKLFQWKTSTNWRGYTGTWKIENDSLFLYEIAHDESEEVVELSQIFNKSLISKKGVFAYWYNEVIDANYGELLGFDEDEPLFSGFFSCRITLGNVSEVRINYRLPNEIRSIKERQKEVMDTLAYIVVEEYPILLAKDRHYKQSELNDFISQHIQLPENGEECDKKSFISIIVEKDGTVDRKEFLRRSNTLCDKEALRIIDLMTNWEPGKIKGEAVRTKFIVSFWNNK